MLFLITSLIIILVIFELIWKNRFNKSLKQPFAIPLFGNLHQLGESPHEALRLLSKTYGRVYGMWFGNRYTVIVNDVDVAREILVKKFDNFIERPKLPSLASASANFKNLAIADEYWWKMAKKKVANTFQKTKLMHHAYDLIHSESMRFVEALGKYSKQGEPVQPRRLCQRFAFNIILQYAFSDGVSYEIKSQNEMLGNERSLNELVESIDAFFKIIANGNLFDFIPAIYPVYYSYLSKYGPQLKVLQLITDIYKKHQETIDIENPRDLIDHLIIESMNNTDTSIDKDLDQIQNIQIGFDFFIAGSDTSSNTLEWFILMMANYPEIQEKCYCELEKLPKPTGQILLSHRRETPYLNAVIKEVMRIHPVIPLGLPRISRESCTLENGIEIPAQTQIVLNIGSICRDEKYFESPMQFIPERFLVENNLSQHVVFGLGNRSCAGSQLALDEIYAAASNILLNFKISTLNPNETISEKEKFSLTIHPVEHYFVNIQSRK
ncbi:cytochrome P450 family protein [Tieghemostelium lacteum]|uniref:Cytochrome P450 family protein n=1 Tax=Tieghemostelium lacteum TaxID=361077 RepID=A0A151ZEZ1_TIELA|nr:cytochrome P450 family protein [Tieghemostelium lacteum]|eukprot:KYQ92487.1 cytochrome P450 family protein [Tieghemostelium lacteum]